MCRYHEQCGDPFLALKLFGDIMAKEESFYPALIETSKIQFCLGRYHLAFESAQRVMRISNSIEALQILIMNQYHVNISTNIDHKKYLEEIIQHMSMSPKSYVKVCMQNAQLFSRLCDNYDVTTLTSALSLVSIAEVVDPHDSKTRLVKAHILHRLGKYKEAINEYQSLLVLNANTVEVSLGMVMSHLLNGDFNDAKKQLEFIELSRDNDCK
jgi:tetratricopeptide (TPR) repeat protein